MLILSSINMVNNASENILFEVIWTHGRTMVESGVIKERCLLTDLSCNTYLGSPLGAKFKGCKIRKLTGETGQGDHGAIENIKFVQVLNTTC